MGFFGKIKENLNHGGIKLDLQAATTVSMQDAAFPVTVTITNTASEQHMVKRVTAAIVANSRDQAFSQPSGNAGDSPTGQTVEQTVARTDNNETFVIMPGEAKTIQLNIVMNAGAAAQVQLPEGSVMAQVAGTFKNLQSVSEALNGNNWDYNLKISVDVEGIALDPTKLQTLQVLKPGEIGDGPIGWEKSF